jgi:hypothetical protein
VVCFNQGLITSQVHMIAILTALLLTIATQAEADCDKLCDRDWWKTATAADVQAELDAGADLTARDQMALHRSMRQQSTAVPRA